MQYLKASLRPIVLLNGMRKILSLICWTDSVCMQKATSLLVKLVFAKCLLYSTAIMYDLDVHFLCLDPSKTFKTPTSDLILKPVQLASDNNGDIMQMAI